MKWIRRLLLCVLAAVALLLIAAGVGYRMLHGRPDWYMHETVDPAAREQLAKGVEDKLTNISNWSQSAWLARQHPATVQPPSPLEISLSDTEINAFLSKWDQLSSVNAQFAGALSDPQVSFNDGHIILAATVDQMQTVVSVHLAPRIDEKGMVHADVEKVMGGQLPLPQTFWNGFANKLAARIDAQIPSSQQRAKLYPDGSANDQMAEAVLAKMMVKFLHGEPADPVVFLKFPARNEFRNLPVKITSVKIADKTLTMTFEPLAAGEKIGEP
jgi:hypothetical protein